MHTSHSYPAPQVTVTTSMTSCSIVSANFMQRPNTETETPEHKTLNNTPVITNEVLSITWKFSVNHTPHMHNTEIVQDNRIILPKGSKLENQHTRITLEKQSRVYKPTNHPIVIRSWLSLLVVPVARPMAT